MGVDLGLNPRYSDKAPKRSLNCCTQCPLPALLFTSVIGYTASQFQIHSFCWPYENESGPFKYFSFASWHDTRFCQQRVLVTHCKRKGVLFPGSSSLAWQVLTTCVSPVWVASCYFRSAPAVGVEFPASGPAALVTFPETISWLSSSGEAPPYKVSPSTLEDRLTASSARWHHNDFSTTHTSPTNSGF